MTSSTITTRVTMEKKTVLDKIYDETPAYKRPFNWMNIFLLSTIHILSFYSLFFSERYPKINSLLFTFLYGVWGLFGVTGGAHRLWAHKAYKANVPLRIILALGYLSTGKYSLYYWIRDHRVHHKFTDTDADPHNSNRGFFYSHVGWLFVKKHPEVQRLGGNVDMTDFWADPVLAFSEKYYIYLINIFTLVIPIGLLPVMWGESWINAVYLTAWRMVVILNVVWAVNSFAHLYGEKPYDRKINPSENLLVSMFVMGEGWHNYHHTFPWDYKTSEYSYYFNFTTVLIDLFACIGWAYDLRQPSENLVKKTITKSGDGSHYKWGHHFEVPEEQNKCYEKSI